MDPGGATGRQCLPARLPSSIWDLATNPVFGGDSGDQSNPGRALRYPHSLLLESLQGCGRPFIREMLGQGDQLFPGSAGLGGGPHPWPGVSDIGWGQLGRIVELHALAILLLG